MASKKRKADILVIGELNIDLIMQEVESFPELGKEKVAGGMEITLGSSSAIFAANSARLGQSVAFCGMIGDDQFGTSVIDDLQNYGVDTDSVITSGRHRTGLTVIIHHNGDRAMVTYTGAMLHFSLNDIPDHAFSTARHLHISSIFLQPGIKSNLFSIIEKAKSRGMTISIDPQWDPDEQWNLDLEKLLKRIDFFLPNETEFLQFTGAKSVETGFQKIDSDFCTTIVKRGKLGATFIDSGAPRTIRAHMNEEPVDAVGAGDSFNAGFIFRFLKGDSIEKCIRFGNITGAVSTTQAGGTAAITGLDETLAIAKQKLNVTDTHDFTG